MGNLGFKKKTLPLSFFKLVIAFFSAKKDFVSPVGEGDIIEFGCELLDFGNSSINVRCEVRNKSTKKIVITVDKITFVNVDRWGNVKKIER